MNKDVVLIDLDGTLTDSAEGVLNSIRYALNKVGVPIPPLDILMMFIGPPLLESYEKYCGLSGEKGWEALWAYREYFNEKGYLENKVYEGIPECLERLKAAGKRMIVATSKPEDYSRKIIDVFGLSPYFEFVSGASLDETRVAKQDIIHYAIEECGLADPSRMIMVGDRMHDVKGAHAEGLECIGVLYGYGSREELNEAGADYIAETPGGIADLILAIEK